MREALREAERRTRQAVDRIELPAAEEAVAAAEEQVRTLRTPQPRRRTAEPAGIAPAEIQAGDRVTLRGLDQPGEAVSAPDARGEIEVQLGSLRTRVKLDQIERVSRPAAPPGPPARSAAATVVRPESPGIELDMRGQRVEDALPQIEVYLHTAFMAGLPFVRIIHGKGTGTLRRVVREALTGNPLVTDFETADPKAGGDGVTVARLAV